jgi:hypothetical protein
LLRYKQIETISAMIDPFVGSSLPAGGPRLVETGKLNPETAVGCPRQRFLRRFQDHASINTIDAIKVRAKRFPPVALLIAPPG